MSLLGKILGKREEEKKPGEKPARSASHSDAGGKKPAPVRAEKLRRSDKKILRGSKPRPQSASGKKPKKEVKTKKVSKKVENVAHHVLVDPLVTEKSTELAQFNKYVFKVRQDAGKSRIREAVRDYYGVGVTRVNIIKIHPKKRMQGRMIGQKKGFKKAVVTLQAGDTIGITEGV